MKGVWDFSVKLCVVFTLFRSFGSQPFISAAIIFTYLLCNISNYQSEIIENIQYLIDSSFDVSLVRERCIESFILRDFRFVNFEQPIIITAVIHT